MFSGEEVEKIDKSDRLQKLMTEYKNLIFSICLKMSGDYFAAEDLTQETFLSVYEHLDSFDGRNEKAWICRIASNLCIDYRRQAARRMIPTSEEEMPPMTTEEAAEQLDLLGHSFYIFQDAETNEVRVVYLRENGDIGLLIPKKA